MALFMTHLRFEGEWGLGLKPSLLPRSAISVSSSTYLGMTKTEVSVRKVPHTGIVIKDL